MNATTRDAVIGGTVIMAVAAATAMLMLFGELNLRSTWQLTLLAPDAAGLTNGSVVTLNGVPVGTVDMVENITDDTWQVRVSASITNDVRVRGNVEPLVSAKLIGGSASLYLETTPTGDTWLATDGSATLAGPLASRATRDLNHAIDERLRPVMASIDNLMAPWSSVASNLNEWLADPELKDGATDVMHLAIASLDRTVETMEQFTALAGSLDRGTNAFLEQAMAAARELTDTLDQTTRLFTSLREGEGSAGQFLTNPDLYRSLETTADELDRLTRSLRLLVEQVREEGVSPLLSP